MTIDSWMSLRIDEWQATRATGELRCADRAVRIEPKVMDLLWLLASADGQVVPHEEILARLWPGLVLNEDTLARTVSKLRKALGDDPRHPHYVGTVPKRGYRLLVPVQCEVRTDPNPVGAIGVLPTQVRSHGFISGRLRRAATALLCVGVLTLAGTSMVALRPSVATAAPQLLADRADDFYFQYSFADNEAAITLYERIIGLRPDYAPAYAGLANALTQKAIRWPTLPATGAAEYTRLRDALKSGHLSSEAARSLLTRASGLAQLAVELAPKDAATHKALGLVRSAQQDFAGALSAYRQAVALDPDAWGALLNIGDVLEISGHDAEALPYLENAWSVMGRIYPHQAVRIRPWYAALGVAIGDRYRERGALDRAERAYREVLEQSPLHREATLKLAEMLARQGNVAAAHTLCNNLTKRVGDALPCSSGDS